MKMGEEVHKADVCDVYDVYDSYRKKALDFHEIKWAGIYRAL